ncbi:peptide MFS transporter [Shewanella intestini]|uniref:Peptide MFS transporter n=1 Tax=Shewanella intestini TaxID=2017544 RepID=A0ABS5HYR3_9GAMM|nr:MULTISPECIES: peptide MFS transporter [Shewanella]MBR9726928.1 peptide MFS transporter [Shewanella intestini]MRG34506.1 MFS transporter [Shewanella sp. XMDDZSB0408]
MSSNRIVPDVEKAQQSKLSSLFQFDLKQRQVNTIVGITFWSQFATYTILTVFIVYLTMPLIKDGLGMTQAQAYAFMGASGAVGYLMPMLGGYMADKVLGIRRSILIGSILMATTYLLVMLGGQMVHTFGHIAFLLPYALLPAAGSLLTGTASALVSKVFSDDQKRAKGGMTSYYMAINIGALIATVIAPSLLHSKYGPLSIFAVVFVGKALAALNFAYRYRMFDSVVDDIDKQPLTLKKWGMLGAYILILSGLTLMVYLNPAVSSYVIGVGCTLGLSIFLYRTLQLHGDALTKQLVAVILIFVAIIFFVMYNQMNTTMVLFAKNNSDLTMFGFHVNATNYQMVNPLSILVLGTLLPRFYRRFHKFTIPYQFAVGIILAGLSMLVMWFACSQNHDHLVNGNYLVLSYFLATIAELFVSALGLSMIGLYCEKSMISFAMGAFYLSSSLSNVITGKLAQVVAIPKSDVDPLLSMPMYQSYYGNIGATAIVIGLFLVVGAWVLHGQMTKRGVDLV